MKDPAFPTTRYYDEEPIGVDEGMSLRDYFAAKALAGIVSNSDLPDLFNRGFAPHKAAECAYAIADAMMAERKKGK